VIVGRPRGPIRTSTPLEFFLADPYIDDCFFQCANNCSNPAHVGVVQSDVHRKKAWL